MLQFCVIRPMGEPEDAASWIAGQTCLVSGGGSFAV